MGNIGGTVKDLVVVNNAAIGLALRNNDNYVENVTVSNNGLLGITGNYTYNAVIKDSVIQNNNTEHFKPAPVSGGVKITRARGVTFTNNDVSGNLSAGFWCDESCYDVDVTNNIANNNATTGIQLEISDTGIVANNQTIGNEIGIQIINTGNVKIFNNEIGDSEKWGLRIKMDDRRNANTSLTGHDARRPNPDPAMPWIVSNITVSNNVFGAGGNFQFLSLDDTGVMSTDAMKVTINGNLFNPSVKGGPSRMVGWGGEDNSIVTYDSPDALAAAKNGSWNNAAVPSQMPLSSMKPYEISLASVAVALPSDVAAVIGQAAGTKRLGTFF
jgi:parallel beta-helix repeat protein